MEPLCPHLTHVAFSSFVPALSVADPKTTLGTSKMTGVMYPPYLRVSHIAISDFCPRAGHWGPPRRQG